jgi:choline dehydrogenase-like flavoprotein
VRGVDYAAVVYFELGLCGAVRLHVADASIMPLAPPGKTNAAEVMISARGLLAWSAELPARV